MNINSFVIENFSNFIWLGIFVLALVPIAEGRIAFPLSINEKILGENALTPLAGFLTCFFASVFLTLFLLTFFKGLTKLLKKFKFFDKFLIKIDKSVEKKSENIKNKNNKYFYLALFVLIPLPLTGAWSACLISNLLNLDFKKSLISICGGNLLSLGLIYILNLFLKDFTIILLIVSFVITFIVILILKLRNKKMNIKYLND